MKILATVYVCGEKVTKPWDFVEGYPEPAILGQPITDNCIIGIPLDPNQIENLREHAHAEKNYLGNLDISQAVLLRMAE